MQRGGACLELFHDASEAGRYIEYVIDENLVEHLRRFDRLTAGDAALREQRLALHVGDGPPVVSRFIAEPPGQAASK